MTSEDGSVRKRGWRRNRNRDRDREGKSEENGTGRIRE